MKFSVIVGSFVFAVAQVKVAAQGIPLRASSTIHINLSPTSDENAVKVNQGFIGFGIEMRSFPHYAGQENPNQFSNNLLKAISDRTAKALLFLPETLQSVTSTQTAQLERLGSMDSKISKRQFGILFKFL
ncbi:uncharacterized protein K452DRAFT_308634 [Aplosporella prunicola CBS 121167]|uniref:Uncharacterized protein n=1 Tax=Aplosporella prunicola CBS 121167 TaxID=1176127 RepID=A0A6A6BI84_9PEZI|nr:uncharacterized protein K452DRAFT_308634 [Aplosporella prunicola CBS 121167]KAF2142271.1 hypothetical protein K452DRAFT_308634 [Aplosporella prunicola CBS 121167]